MLSNILYEDYTTNLERDEWMIYEAYLVILLLSRVVQASQVCFKILITTA